MLILCHSTPMVFLHLVLISKWSMMIASNAKLYTVLCLHITKMPTPYLNKSKQNKAVVQFSCQKELIINIDRIYYRNIFHHLIQVYSNVTMWH